MVRNASLISTTAKAVLCGEGSRAGASQQGDSGAVVLVLAARAHFPSGCNRASLYSSRKLTRVKRMDLKPGEYVKVSMSRLFEVARKFPREYQVLFRSRRPFQGSSECAILHQDEPFPGHEDDLPDELVDDGYDFDDSLDADTVRSVMKNAEAQGVVVDEKVFLVALGHYVENDGYYRFR